MSYFGFWTYYFELTIHELVQGLCVFSIKMHNHVILFCNIILSFSLMLLSRCATSYIVIPFSEVIILSTNDIRMTNCPQSFQETTMYSQYRECLYILRNTQLPTMQ